MLAGTSRKAIWRSRARRCSGSPLGHGARRVGRAPGRDRRDGDGEHPLGNHVDPERGIDRARRDRPVDVTRREEGSDQCVDVDQPQAKGDRKHQDEHALHGRVAPVDRQADPAVEPGQPRQRQEQLDHRADDDRAGVDVELSLGRIRPRDADHEPGDDRQVPEDRRQRRDGEVLVAVEDPDDDPEDPEQDDDRKRFGTESPRGLPSRPPRSRRGPSPTARRA